MSKVLREYCKDASVARPAALASFATCGNRTQTANVGHRKGPAPWCSRIRSRPELWHEPRRMSGRTDRGEHAVSLPQCPLARSGVAREARQLGALEEHERAVADRAGLLDEPLGAVQRFRDRA